jgi:hypothetical protein
MYIELDDVLRPSFERSLACLPTCRLRGLKLFVIDTKFELLRHE